MGNTGNKGNTGAGIPNLKPIAGEYEAFNLKNRS
jgi:hypothetical protein